MHEVQGGRVPLARKDAAIHAQIICDLSAGGVAAVDHFAGKIVDGVDRLPINHLLHAPEIAIIDKAASRRAADRGGLVSLIIAEPAHPIADDTAAPIMDIGAPGRAIITVAGAVHIVQNGIILDLDQPRAELFRQQIVPVAIGETARVQLMRNLLRLLTPMIKHLPRHRMCNNRTIQISACVPREKSISHHALLKIGI
ncbi:MAG: hypothetical protein AAF216_13170 [Pseudomonadota bacterium]